MKEIFITILFILLIALVVQGVTMEVTAVALRIIELNGGILIKEVSQ